MHDTVETILKELLTSMGIADAKVSRTELAGQTIFSVHTDSDGRSLIGAHGDTVHALDMLVKKIAEKRLETGGPQDMHFLVDVNEYRAKQIQDLQTKALMMAERARSFQYDVELTPMSAYERLIVHTTLQDAPNVKTESLGEGRNRRVVIKYTV
jgi:spoIIIJ-associated protein